MDAASGVTARTFKRSGCLREAVLARGAAMVESRNRVRAQTAPYPSNSVLLLSDDG